MPTSRLAHGKSILALHFSVVLFGGAGLFGKFFAIPTFLLVLGRTVFASIALALVLKGRVIAGKLPKAVFLCGATLALHWVVFFRAIEVSSVSIGLMGFSSFPVFIIGLEPIFFREPIKWSDRATSAVVVLGLVLLVPMESEMRNVGLGLFYGVVSGFTFAVLTLLNRAYTQDLGPMRLAFWQNFIAGLCLIPFQTWPIELSARSWAGLVVLGVVFTAISHTAFMYSLKALPGRLVSITVALEPVYGTCLAVLFLGEVLTQRFLVGSTLIVGATVLSTLARK